MNKPVLSAPVEQCAKTLSFFIIEKHILLSNAAWDFAYASLWPTQRFNKKESVAIKTIIGSYFENKSKPSASLTVILYEQSVYRFVSLLVKYVLNTGQDISSRYHLELLKFKEIALLQVLYYFLMHSTYIKQ